MNDFLFRGSISALDPDLHDLNQFEAERQFRRLILIPSESTAPLAVRAALETAFQNIYAEGYPPEEWRLLTEEELLDYDARLGEYRRLSDPRYYKGVEYADIVESLARRRAAELFAANGLTADDLFVNVQALSGGPANNAVYHALIEPGDTVMGMDLIYGGHLSHGSPVNRSGKYYNIVSYTIDPETEKLDYEQMRALARQHKPKMIIGGYSSYPWQADWDAYRSIADEVGAYLLADVAHVAGLIAGGVYPSPVGIADVVTTTTHKTLCGPRGALIITHKSALARKLDRAVFPGEQGGPHVNVFSALALAMKLAGTEQFTALQQQIVDNCAAFADRLAERGFKIPFGGTNTHLMNLDAGSVTGPDGTALSGDMAARILDLAGIVVNRNTIPGDRSALNPSGIRMGTPWITQRGFKEAECVRLADCIADLLMACTPYVDPAARRRGSRAKVAADVLQDVRSRVRVLAESAGIDFVPGDHAAPHFPHRERTAVDVMDWVIFEIDGEKRREFANFVFTSDVDSLQSRSAQHTTLNAGERSIKGVLALSENGSYLLRVPGKEAGATGTWLRDLSDGFIRFDPDLVRKIPGPVSVRAAGHGLGDSALVPNPTERGTGVSATKPYFVGIEGEGSHPNGPLPAFQPPADRPDAPLRETPLHAEHLRLGARMVPFGGWDMPVWYTSVKEEHAAVRTAAGLFDVAHMGVYQAEGPGACAFLDSVCGNDISALTVGQSCYTHFLDPNANVIDDLLVYRRAPEKYLVVVNASNDEKDWAWLNAVKNGVVRIDEDRPWAHAYGRDAVLRNLRQESEGEDRVVDLALQGPKSLRILLRLTEDPVVRRRIENLARTELTEAELGGIDLVVSRTGYTGERIGFELFVHPDRLVDLWTALLDAGEDLGLLPCGLGARDSLRTEAGLPLYGHEMGGELKLGVGEAGFGSYVKTYKPWFIGRAAFIKRELKRAGELVRFTFEEQNVRMAHTGDPVLDRRGRTIGVVTSCAVDARGFLTGQAFLEMKYTEIGAPLYVYQGASKTSGKAPADLRFGDRVPVPTPAKVVARFPKL
ncbi:MAG TPA: glycine cleavage system aminomethyltransferase GcvT [Anaerolineales bacterium]|nr:glycine cleavage system aminomethyltransferase GcvT [Anaerolineales bacterium]